MDLIAWAFYAFIAAAVVVAAALHYRLREPGGPGRGVLMALRGSALALLVLLLFDPVMPAAGAGGGTDTIVLLDASLSMGLPEREERTRWDAAREIAASVAGDRVLGFGGEVAEPGERAGPEGPRTLLAPAIRAAAEAGARRVVVVTDAGVEDAAEAARVAERAGVAVEFRRVGDEPPANAGIVEVDAPGWAEVGEEAGIRVGVAALATAAESLTVVLRRGARELARSRVEAPEPGRLATTTLRFTPTAAATGPVRLDVALEGTDAAAADDVRSVYVRIAEEPAGVALVSFRPDQEPRFLLPVLERALGVPVRGWMALPEGRYIRLGAGAEAGVTEREGEAMRAVREADLVVLHGLGPSAPPWAQEAVASAGRVLVFPAAPTVEGLPFAPGPERVGDWYPAPEIPASPIAPLLAGAEPEDAPPLRALRTPAPPAGWWAPLEARLGRRGEGAPVLLAGTPRGRRVAVALGEGYWRWAFAGGAARDTYERLWAGVGAWLAAETGTTTAAAVLPLERVVARGQPVRFRVPPGADSVAVRVSPAGSAEAVVDTTLRVRDGEAAAPPLPPGHYAYEARAFTEGQPVRGSGPVTVESYSPELTRAPVALQDIAADGAAGAGSGRARPLRASAWPWVLLVLLLCGEWILRRRWGLR